MVTMPILYDSLDYSTKTLLESMCEGGFLQKDENEGWDLYENLVKIPSNGNQLVKALGIQTPSLQKEVSIQLNHP